MTARPLLVDTHGAKKGINAAATSGGDKVSEVFPEFAPYRLVVPDTHGRCRLRRRDESDQTKHRRVSSER